MGLEYALVHLKYTIPPAIALTCIYRPFLQSIDIYKISFLIAIAVVSTIPWGAYLIQRKIWTYPFNVVVGPKLCSIPVEELFFFVIQTYNTTLLYLLLNKPIFHSIYLREREDWVDESYLSRGNRGNAPFNFKTVLNVGQLILGSLIVIGGFLVWQNGKGTYLGLILLWAGPFALLLWSLSHQFLMRLPYTSILLPIALPTLYLWIVDTWALKRGTWSIEAGTKSGLHLWDGLGIEEAVFFLATNILIVFGLVAFDHALSILWTFPTLFPTVSVYPSPKLLLRALLTDIRKYDHFRIHGIQEAVDRLRKKSRSFYLASSAFQGRLRIDLILLYSFCRVADDLVDEAKTDYEAREWIIKLMQYLDLVYKSRERIGARDSWLPDLHTYILDTFPSSSYAALRLLPTQILSAGPLYELLAGFKTDLEFKQPNSAKGSGRFPIKNEHDLSTYSTRVAGTVAEMCLELVFHHTSTVVSSQRRNNLVSAGARMGIALQYVNICRDVAADAAIGRVYLPTSWLEEDDLKPQQVVEDPTGRVIDKLRGRLLEKAFGIYREARPAIEQIPEDARVSMRVVVESYMEIGRVMREREYKVAQGQATVPNLRRIAVAWKALSQG